MTRVPPDGWLKSGHTKKAVDVTLGAKVAQRLFGRSGARFGVEERFRRHQGQRSTIDPSSGIIGVSVDSLPDDRLPEKHLKLRKRCALVRKSYEAHQGRGSPPQGHVGENHLS